MSYHAQNNQLHIHDNLGICKHLSSNDGLEGCIMCPNGKSIRNSMSNKSDWHCLMSHFCARKNGRKKKTNCHRKSIKMAQISAIFALMEPARIEKLRKT